MKHLYCAGKIGNTTKDKLSDCIGLFGKGCEFQQRAPLQSPSFTCSRKCAIVVSLSSFSFFLFKSVSTFTQAKNFKLIHMRCKQSFRANSKLRIQNLTLLWGLKWPLCLAPNSFQLSIFQRDSNYENLQRRNGPSALRSQDLRHFSRLSDHTTYMQTSTVMNLLCVYVCV